MDKTESSRCNGQKHGQVVGALLLCHQIAEGDLYSEKFHIPSEWYDDDKYHGYMMPSKIRFSQKSIKNVFSHEPHAGVPIKSLADKLVNGKRTLEDLEPLNVAVDNTSDKVYTLGNRRLWALREAERRGKCSEIPVVIRPFRTMHKKMFTTKNDGRSVRIRGSGSRAQSWSRPDKLNADSDKYTRRDRTKNRGNRRRRLVEKEFMKEQDFSL